MRTLELWGGVECSLNRVGDTYIDHNRLPDLQSFAGLGIKKMNYPCLWERVAPKDLDHCHWALLDERLDELRKLNVTVIANFLHHGSGPQYTSLIDPEFPEKFATYARLFAQRYPWIEDYSPIHEINKTARFSCLEGHWYPHLKSSTYYFKALIHQCKATVLAMREIRRINHKANLIQNEEIDKNEDWPALDLLLGKITHYHFLYKYFKDAGIRDEEIEWFEDNRCPPNIIGINHEHSEEVLQDNWNRYQIALAITGSEKAQSLSQKGINIEAAQEIRQ